MKLHSPHFENRLRAGCERILGQHSEWKREARRAPRVGARGFFGVMVRVLISLGLGLAIYYAGTTDWPHSAQSALGALWFLGLALVMRGRILDVFYGAEYLAAFTVLPAPWDLVWRWNRQRSLRLAWRAGLDAVAVLSAIALINDANLAAWVMVVPAAVLLALGVQAMAMWLTFVPIPFVVTMMPTVGFIGLIVCANSAVFRGWLVGFLLEYSGTMTMALPGGWVLGAFLAAITGTEPRWISLLIPATALVASLMWAYRRLATIYAPFEFALWNAFQVPPAEFKESFDQMLAEQPAPPGVTEISDAIRTREFLAPGFPAEDAPWIERRVLRWLTGREQVVLELACVELPRWTHMALSGVGLIVLGIGAAALARRGGGGFFETMSVITAGLCGFAGVLLALPLSAGFKRVFEPVESAGVKIAFGAVFPATLKELLRLAWKINLMRGVFLLPLFALAGVWLGFAMKVSIPAATLAALKIVALSVALTPMLLVTNLSSVTNDTSKFSFRAILITAAFCAGYLGFIAFGAASFFVPWPGSVVCIVLAGIIAAAMAKFYAAMEARRAFDFIARRGKS